MRLHPTPRMTGLAALPWVLLVALAWSILIEQQQDGFGLLRRSGWRDKILDGSIGPVCGIG